MIYRFGGFELDDDRFELRHDGESVTVEPQVFEVIAHLVRNHERLIPKEELLDEVWGTRFVTESTLTTRIKTARKVLGDDGRRQAVIATVHGRGYRMAAEITEVAPRASAVDRAPPAEGQRISFCTTSDDVRLAYATHGSGPLLVKAASWLTHVDHDWNSPLWRHWMTGLGAHHRLVRYDERGSGLSDWDVEDFSVDAWVRDLSAVVDDVGVERFPLLGISQGAAVAIAYAVANPERVSRLVLCGSYATGWLAGRSPERHRQRAEALIEVARVGWGARNPAFRQLFTTSFLPSGTQEDWSALDELQRTSTSPANAVRFLEAFFRLDVTGLAEQVAVPTLVLHARGDQVWPFEQGRRLASSIPGARFVPLDSDNHMLTAHEPAWPVFLDEVERFLAED